LEELAKAKPRIELDVDYDGYKISTAAKTASTSARISQLSLPPARRRS